MLIFQFSRGLLFDPCENRFDHARSSRSFFSPPRLFQPTAQLKEQEKEQQQQYQRVLKKNNNLQHIIIQEEEEEMLAKPIEKSIKRDGNDDDKDKKTVSESPLLKSFSNVDDFQSSNSSVLASSDEEESELTSSKSVTDTSFSTTIAEHPLFTIGDGSTATGSQAVSVKGEEESSEGNMNEPAWSNSVFVDRVRSIPLVAAGFDQYETWKRYGKLTGLACSAVESTVATLSKPVLKTLEPFQSKVDEFGCKQLDLLEEKFPLIKENPDVLNRKAFATMTLLYETLG